MDREKRLRRPLRARITRVVNEAEVELGKEAPDKDLLIDKLMDLEECMEKVTVLDDRIMEAMLDVFCTDEQQDEEYKGVEEYQVKVRRTRMKLNSFLYPGRRSDGSPTPSEASVVHTTSSVSSHKRSFKLPKIELKTFDGNLKEWLGFWSQFTKIDEDETLHDTDKFQYLVQAMVPGTEPSELVKSFPQSAANYPKAVEALKKRFGREQLLIQVYVRELLVLAFHNVTSKERIPVSKMFIQLKSHLRALDSLNLATADPSTWLFPLVESSLPVETLKAWQRSGLSQKDGSAETPPKSALDYLMEFLEREVESDQRIELASNGLRDLSMEDKKNGSSGNQKKNSKEKSDVPTASGLFS